MEWETKQMHTEVGAAYFVYCRCQQQCFGSIFIENGSGFRFLWPKMKREKIQLQKNNKYFFYLLNCIMNILRPPWRSSKLQKRPPAIKREHPALPKMKFLACFRPYAGQQNLLQFHSDVDQFQFAMYYCHQDLADMWLRTGSVTSPLCKLKYATYLLITTSEIMLR